MTDRTFTTDEKRAAIERELKLRRKHYPGGIENGAIEKTQADREIAIWEAILAEIERLYREEARDE